MGDDDGAAAYDDADEVVDLEGALVTPAFVDSHIHTVRTGFALTQLDLTGATSREHLLDLLSSYAAGHPHDLLVGNGWDETRWPSRRAAHGRRDRAGGARSARST